MDDMTLFDRFHAAFEEAPPRGAFERLQRELIDHSPARRAAEPAFRMRFGKMGFRVAAAVAAVVIAIVLVAAYLAGQHPSVGGLPAGSSQNVADYQSLVRTDHDGLWNLPLHCQPITDPQCQSDGAANIAAAVKWRSDLESFRTPPQFAVIDHQMRAHLFDLLGYMAAEKSAVIAGDANAYATAIGFSGNDVTWLDKITNAITSTRVATADQYTSFLKAEYDAVSCSSCSSLTAIFTPFCPSIDDALCSHDIANAFQGVGQLQEDLTQNRAPSQFAGKEATVQGDLATADDALMQMGVALFHGDATTLMSARTAFLAATSALTDDLQS